MLREYGGLPPDVHQRGGRAAPTRYTYIAADFSVRGGDACTIKITDPDKDVAFAFLGGNSTNGWWLDAGLQYSPLRRDWALFIRDKGKALSSKTGVSCPRVRS